MAEKTDSVKLWYWIFLTTPYYYHKVAYTDKAILFKIPSSDWHIWIPKGFLRKSWSSRQDVIALPENFIPKIFKIDRRGEKIEQREVSTPDLFTFFPKECTLSLKSQNIIKSE